MVTSVLHDNLKRSVNILPSKCNFGFVKVNTESEIIVSIKNEDSLSQRINIKPTGDSRVVVTQECYDKDGNKVPTYGPIAPGMHKQIIVTIRGSLGPDESAKIKLDVIIMTKTDHYKYPVEAHILTEEEFAARENDLATTSPGKSMMNSRVRNKLSESIAKSQKLGVMQKFRKEMGDGEDMEMQEEMGMGEEFDEMEDHM